MDFRVRADLPSFMEQSFSGLQETQFAFRCCDGIQLAVSLKPVGWIVAVQHRSEKGRQIRLLPYLWRRFMPDAMVNSVSKLSSTDQSIAYLSPRKSTTYACTPPGILTSTRTSTLEKALKQLSRWFGLDRYRSQTYSEDVPVTAIPHLPPCTFREPSSIVFNRVG